ncbi:unnamed protein product [Penicillium salamii]|nr:unnamed protein product [Penicillium salamii]
MVSVKPTATRADSTPEPSQPPLAMPSQPTYINLGVSETAPATTANPTEIEASPDSSATDSIPRPEPHRFITSRHGHVLTESGHSVTIGGRQILQRCEDEPIRIPGAIQSFGVIIALREESPDQLVVRVVSENSEQVFGYSAQQLFALHSFFDIMSENQITRFTEHLDYVRDDGHDLDADGPEVFLLSILSSGETRRFWCAAHVSQENKDIIICEFELEEDRLNPLNVEDDLTGTPLATTPSSEVPTNILGIKPTPAQFTASTVSSSQSFRALRYARRRKGEAAAMQIFNTISPIQEQLSLANDSETLLEITAGLVKELVGFHRVLIYQFDSNWNGKVMAELVDPQVTVDLYKGLHFPASDIPAQARELYKVNRVRLLYDRDHSTSRLVCRTLEDLETPLDMTHAYLRAMSPIHTQYLANMGVRSSMSISINAFGNLWGLISCHSYGCTGMRVSFPIRKLCRLVGDTVARNIERIERGVSLQAQGFVNAVPKETNPASCIVASSDDLMRFLGADSGALLIRKEVKLLGVSSHAECTSSQEILALLEYLRARRVTSVLVSHDITKDFPDFQFTLGARNISGLLCVPLSTTENQFLVFFRCGQLTTVTWAGNPYETAKCKQAATGNHLTPRQSFNRWSETVLAQSRHWSGNDIATAKMLGMVYGKFIDVWRQKEVMKRNTRLTRLLVANSAHEVRTPLNAIINYLELALEGTLDDEIREGLLKSHSASKSLIYIINDLLDLTITADRETSQQLVNKDSFDLLATFQDAADMLAGESERKGISFSCSMHTGLPAFVMGDQRRVRQVFLNIISNAIQNTESGSIKIGLCPSSTQNTMPGHVAVEMTVTDTAANIKQKKSVLGLGLALTARIAHNMHGQLIFKSEESKGSQFKLMLQFRCPEHPAVSASPKDLLPKNTNTPESSIGLEAQGYPLLDASDEHNVEGKQESPQVTCSGNQPSGGRLSDQPLDDHSQDPSLDTEIAFDDGNIQHSAQPLSPRSTKEGPTSMGRHSSVSELSSTSPDTGKRPPRDMRSSTPSSSGLAASEQRTSSTQSCDSNVQLSSRSRSVQSGSSIPRIFSTTPGTSDHSSSIATPPTEPSRSPLGGGLQVLVAEDDPINSKLIKKRLEKIGHTVLLTNNGEACVNAFSSERNAYDVILMDIQVCPPKKTNTYLPAAHQSIFQMPVVDGITATKLIREMEVKSTDAESERFTQTRHVPILAVSASIVETSKDVYIDHGFDGWIMKPVNFARLNELLDDVKNSQIGKDNKPWEWENGGWFDGR